MDQELIDYVINHYSHLLSMKEKLALKHHHVTQKASNQNDSPLKDMMLKRWGTKDQETLDLLNNGFEEFKRISAGNILKDQKDKVFVNTCAKCGRLARTPLAKQCRHCGHNWH